VGAPQYLTRAVVGPEAGMRFAEQPGMLLGSTSQALIYYAPCPLLVVRPTVA
jgi:nucleotide-binding universal stress UspA family protein